MGTSRIASVGSNIMTQPSGIDVVKRQEEAAEVMFADMISMNGSADVDNFTADVADEMLGTVEANETDTRRERPTDAYEKYQYQDKNIRTESGDNRSEKLKETVEEVEEFEESVTEVIAEELHITKEELEAAMEELGLTYLDLLDNSKLADLVAKITGSENVNQLLCDASFTNILHQVNTLGTELLQEVQMTPEELNEIQMLIEQNEATEIQMPVEQEMTFVETESVVNVDEIGKEADEVDFKQGAVSEEMSVEDTTDDSMKIEVVHAESMEEQKDSSEENLSDTAGKATTQTSVLQGHEAVVADVTQSGTFAEQLNGVETVQTLPPHITVADIMEQFAEQTRVLLSADTTKMEMQLNPEHLGKLYVEVIENEGAITAKIQTQNAVVKEALEMQIADLKVNLNQAGVKVDSVEVTIASHEFERNLEQDANSQKQQEEAQPKATRHRNINLNGLDELSGLMTEEETLVAKMMAEQGNSVDFTA